MRLLPDVLDDVIWPDGKRCARHLQVRLQVRLAAPLTSLGLAVIYLLSEHLSEHLSVYSAITVRRVNDKFHEIPR